MNRNLIIGSLLAVITVVGWAWHDYQHALTTVVVAENPVLIEIKKGDSFNNVSDTLLAQHVAISPFWFKVIAIQQQALSKLKTGEYELAVGSTIPSVLAQLVQGKTKHYAITFPEGWCFKQLLQAINNHPQLDHTLNGSDANMLMATLNLPYTHPEGAFFPDTYFFEKHTTDIALLKRAAEKMQVVIQQEWANKAANLPFNTPYEALILASIVEKETGEKSERPLIAGVFIRRLQRGMLLQTDPTVIYGMGDNYHGDISYNDLKTATPYNTYVITGLPPTPIAMPGRQAIHAVLHPETSNNLYFVARGDGRHQFSATLTQHNLAVDHWQRQKK